MMFWMVVDLCERSHDGTYGVDTGSDVDALDFYAQFVLAREPDVALFLNQFNFIL